MGDIDAKHDSASSSSTASKVMNCIPTRLHIPTPDLEMPKTLVNGDQCPVGATFGTGRKSVASHRFQVPSVLVATAPLALNALISRMSAIQGYHLLDVKKDIDIAISKLDNLARGIQRLMLSLSMAAKFRLNAEEWRRNVVDRVSFYTTVAFFLLNRRIRVVDSAEHAASNHLPDHVVYFGGGHEKLSELDSAASPEFLKSYRLVCENKDRCAPNVIRARQEEALRKIATAAITALVDAKNGEHNVPMGAFFRQFGFALSARVLLDVAELHVVDKDSIDEHWRAVVKKSTTFASKYVPMLQKWGFTFHVLDAATRKSSCEKEKTSREQECKHHPVAGLPGILAENQKFGDKPFPRFISSVYLTQHVQFLCRLHSEHLRATDEISCLVFCPPTASAATKKTPLAASLTIQSKEQVSSSESRVELFHFMQSASAYLAILKQDEADAGNHSDEPIHKRAKKDDSAKRSKSPVPKSKARSKRLLGHARKIFSEKRDASDIKCRLLCEWMVHYPKMDIGHAHKCLGEALLGNVVDWLMACPPVVQSTNKKRKGSGILHCYRSMYRDHLSALRLSTHSSLFEPIASSLSAAWTPTTDVTSEGSNSVIRYNTGGSSDYRFSAAHLDLDDRCRAPSSTSALMIPRRVGLDGCKSACYQLLQGGVTPGSFTVSDVDIKQTAREIPTRVRCFPLKLRGVIGPQFAVQKVDLPLSGFTIYGRPEDEKKNFVLSDFECDVIDRMCAAPFIVKQKLFDVCLFFSIIFYHLEDVHRSLRLVVDVDASSGAHAEVFEREISKFRKQSREQLESHGLYSRHKSTIEALLEDGTFAFNYKAISSRLGMEPVFHAESASLSGTVVQVPTKVGELCWLLCRVRLGSERHPTFRFKDEDVRDVQRRECVRNLDVSIDLTVRTLGDTGSLHILQEVVVGQPISAHISNVLARLSVFQQLLKTQTPLQPLYDAYVRCHRIASGQFPPHFFDDPELMRKFAVQAVSEVVNGVLSFDAVSGVCRAMLEQYDWKDCTTKAALLDLLHPTLFDLVSRDKSLSVLPCAVPLLAETYCR